MPDQTYKDGLYFIQDGDDLIIQEYYDGAWRAMGESGGGQEPYREILAGPFQPEDLLRMQWVSIKERLPEDGQLVLVGNTDGGVALGEHYPPDRMPHDKQRWHDTQGFMLDVARWMLLPTNSCTPMRGYTLHQ